MTMIDGHVHFYPSFSMEAFLTGVASHLRGAQGVLLLAQPNSDDALALVRDRLQSMAGWTIEEPDQASLLVKNSDTTIALIAGRQVVTKERLEVLALGTTVAIPHGLALRKTIEHINQQQAVSVLPWGFGKWWGKRGRFVKELIRSNDLQFLIGDSGCRPKLLSETIFAEAKRHGYPILAGTDPLPIKSHESRAGSYCTMVSEPIDLSRPTAWVREQLGTLSSTTISGSLRSLPRFLDDQIRIRAPR